MDSIFSFVSANFAGFITGIIVALLQLGIIYLWIDRHILNIQNNTEALKWKMARTELRAILLSLAYTTAKPLAYYILYDEDGVYFRDRYSSCLQHIIDKSRAFDAMLAIYSVGLEPKSFTQIAQLADSLRIAANNAMVVLNKLNDIEAIIVPAGQRKARRVLDLKRATTSIGFKLPSTFPDREEKLFGHYLLQVIDQVAMLSEQMSALALHHYDVRHLDRTAHYKRLYELSQGEQTASTDRKQIEQSIKHLKAIMNVAENQGLRLEYVLELD